MRKFFLLFAAFILLALPGVAHAQSEELVLKIHREFGYGGFDNRIEGRFSMEVEGPQDLAWVEFYIDDALVDHLSAAPFQTEFHTSEYAPGAHQLYALGESNSGAPLRSNAITRVFLTSEEARNATVSFIGPLLAFIAVLMVLGFLVQGFFLRKRGFTLGEYGLAGGALCKQCGLPFARHAMSPNLVVGKLERCPHCGKWAIVARASADELADAEARMRAEERAGAAKPEEDEADRLRRQIDDSRYD